MRLWDWLQLHTVTNDFIRYVIFMGGVKDEYPLDLIPYACLIEKVAMWEIEVDDEKTPVFKIWLETE